MTQQDQSGRAQAVTLAESYFERGEFVSDLRELVACPSESQRAGSQADLSRYLTELIQPRLEALGFSCDVLPHPDAAFGPFLIAERIENPDFPTVLCYGHSDVVLGQRDHWRPGLQPFELTVEGNRIYGRGSADNKGQHLINIAALEAVLETRGSLGFNMKFLFESAEEMGSPGLADCVKHHRDRLQADVLLASDGPRLQPDVPTLFLGARGACNFELSVHLRDGAHHSGNWGGLLADPAIRLTQALATICDSRGQIRIPEWRPESLTEDVRAALASLPVATESGPEVDEDWGEEPLTPAERAYGWNSFSILAMLSGEPDAPLNAISGSAQATCQLRYVVGTDPDDIVPALRRHLDRHGFQDVATKSTEQEIMAATRLSPNNPWVTWACSSIEQTVGISPHVLPNLAGSLPNDCFADILGLPTLWVPHSYRGCSQHAPNEHLLAPICREGLAVMAGLFWDLSDAPTTP